MEIKFLVNCLGLGEGHEKLLPAPVEACVRWALDSEWIHSAWTSCCVSQERQELSGAASIACGKYRRF